jgi:RNA polymerase sigma factor (sigma-70 family)
MGSQSGLPAPEAERSAPVRPDSLNDFRRLSAMLARSARRLGSRDPESAAQEALKRSVDNRSSSRAVEYYFAEVLPPDTPPPEWRLDQLLAWLHAVLHYVVREERSRAAYRREAPLSAQQPDQIDLPDPAADQLETLIRSELQDIIERCFQSLDREYRTVLKWRADGLKYKDIAARLGVNENTVATWISRGIQALGRCARIRLETATGRAEVSSGERNDA